MSLLFKSPMPKKYQAFFFLWTFVVMGLFALVGINISRFQAWTAVLFLVIALLMAGFGFMIRKRVLRSIGIVKEQV